MQRCFQLARKGLGSVAPNPMVGAVIVKGDRIIGEGFHQEFGGKHAEINAIENVKNQNDLEGATLYVNLEPCNHHGKTPPCADRILETGISRVIISGNDPSLKVNGNGIEKLRKGGLEVITKLLNQEEEELNKRFRTFHREKRPYIILKWAQSADGFMDKKRAFEEKGQFQLSNVESKRLLHKWRSEEMAIMIGTNTALTDNPSLNVRLVEGKDPLRIVLDLKGRLSNNLKLFKDGNKTLVYTAQLKKAVDNVEYRLVIDDKRILDQLITDMTSMEIQSLIVEGGKALLESFLMIGLWDEIRLFESPLLLIEGLRAPEISQKPNYQDHVGDNLLLVYKKAE